MTTAPDFFPPEPPPDELRFLEEPPQEYDYEPEPFMVAPGQQVLPGMEPPDEPPDHWAWLDARFVGLEQVDADGNLTGYEVGCVDLYADTVSGDLGGMFLRVQAFGPDEFDRAEDLFNRLNGYASEKNLAAYELPDLAGKVARQIAGREGYAPPQWRELTTDEYGLFAREFGLGQQAGPDTPPEYAHDELLRTAYELGGVEVEQPDRAAQALHKIGLSAEGFDPDRDMPPFYDQTTNTAYWVGIYQPQADDREVCFASILSLTRDPASGAYEAQLAPCMVGDWDQAYAASEHLIGIAERSEDIERVFEAAEGMAIAANQREGWQHGRGVPLEPESAQYIGDYAARTWELDL